jgi:hypothetical protein
VVQRHREFVLTALAVKEQLSGRERGKLRNLCIGHVESSHFSASVVGKIA